MHLLNTVDTYNQLQSFSTVEEMNANTAVVRERYGDKLTPSTYRVLDVLVCYACKYPGVCYRSKAKIATELGIDRKTVTRACAALETLGVIKQYATKRADGDKRRSTDAIVFLPQIEEVPTECPDIETPLKAIKILSNTQDTASAELSTAKDVIKQGLLMKLPQSIARTLSLFGDINAIYRLYGVMLRAKASVDRHMKFEDEEHEYNNALMSVISAWKRGKVRSLDAVLYEATKRTARSLWLNERMSEPLYL